MVRGAVERPLWRQVRVLPHTFSLQRLPPAPPVPWACGRAKEATAGPRGAGGGLERRCSTVPPVDALDAAVGWPCASHVHVHGASRGTPVPHAPGGCENAGMAGKGARGRRRAPIGCARVHANDASVGLFRVYNSSCVTVCMIVSLVSLILSHSSSSARDWNRFQAVLDEPATGLGASAVWSAPTAGRRYPTLALSHHPLVTKSRRPPPRHMSARVLRAGQHAARSRIALRVV